MGLKERMQRPKKDPWWKRRINNDIKQLRTVVSKLERIQNNEMHSNRGMEYTGPSEAGGLGGLQPSNNLLKFADFVSEKDCQKCNIF